MQELQQEGKPSTAAEPAEMAGFCAVRELIRTRPGEFIRALDELFLIGTNVQLFSDPHARADLLALDPRGVAVVVAVEREGEHSLLEYGLMCAGLVAGWRPDFFFRYPSAGPSSNLRAFLQVPDEQVNRTQRVVLVAHSHEYAIYGAAQWLAQRHGIEIWCVQAAVDAASRRLELTRLGPESFGQEATPVETVRVVFPQPCGTAFERPFDEAPGLPLQPALDPLTATVTGVCQLQTIWRPEAETAASRSIEGRLQQILDEELQRAGAALEAAPAQPFVGPQAAVPAQPAPAVEAPETTEQAGVTATPTEPAIAAQPETSESASPKTIWIVGVLLLTAVGLAGMLLLSLRRPVPGPQAQSVTQPEPPTPPPAAGVFSNSVRDAVTGRPIPGARLYYAGQTLLAGPSGEFQFQVVEGERKLLVRAPGYRQAATTIDSKEPIRLEPIDVRGYYLSHSHVADSLRRESILRLIRGTSANAVVLGVKDVTGRLNVAVKHPLAGEIGAAVNAEAIGLARQVAAWKSEGVYTVALLALFKDDLLARRKPELGLRSILTRQPIIDPDEIAWTDPSSQAVRDYNIEVAKAAAAAGFDEIHFDFIRYPAESPSDEGGSPAEYERRLASLLSFLRGANQALAPYNVYLSASVFGSVCSIPNAGVIGQKIEEFAAQLDYVSPMLYPSYFEPGQRYPDPLRYSYELVYENLRRAAGRLEGDSRKLRPWLQNFPDSASPDEALEADSIRNQVKAAEDAGASGWMLWDSRNHYRNTAEALNLLKSERGRAAAPKPDADSGGSLLLVSGPGDGEPPTANPGQQFRLLGVLLLAGCCLGVLYAAARAEWLFHKWSRSGHSRRPATAAPASDAPALLGGRVSWAAFPRLRHEDHPFPGPLRRAAGSGADSN